MGNQEKFFAKVILLLILVLVFSPTPPACGVVRTTANTIYDNSGRLAGKTDSLGGPAMNVI